MKINPLKDVTEFHKAFGVEVGGVKPRDTTYLRNRFDFLSEEMQEIIEGIEDGNGEEILDGLVDLVYFAVGTAVALGYDFNTAWQRVHDANMAKLGSEGHPFYDARGKVVKPDGWTAPDLADLVKHNP